MGNMNKLDSIIKLLAEQQMELQERMYQEYLDRAFSPPMVRAQTGISSDGWPVVKGANPGIAGPLVSPSVTGQQKQGPGATLGQQPQQGGGAGVTHETLDDTILRYRYYRCKNCPVQVTFYSSSINPLPCDCGATLHEIKGWDTDVVKFKVCECGKEKHGFASHSNWCAMHEKG